MNVQELIDHLQEIEDKTLPVAVYADHGQCGMNISYVDLLHIGDPYAYMMEELCLDGKPNYVLIEAT